MNGVATLLAVPEAGGEIGQEVAELVRRSGLEVDEIVVEQGRLDDVFRDLTSVAH